MKTTDELVAAVREAAEEWADEAYIDGYDAALDLFQGGRSTPALAFELALNDLIDRIGEIRAAADRIVDEVREVKR
jgi:hypothetical protein